MSALTQAFYFQEGARRTGIWSKFEPAITGTGNLAAFYYIDIPADQDVEVESSFLSAFLPFYVGGFYGNNPDGSQWIVIALVGPFHQDYDFVFANSSLDTLLNSLDRALSFNSEAEARADQIYKHEDLIGIYTEQGIDGAALDWPTSDLAFGLLAETCGVPLEQIVAGYAGKCAYPDTEHICESSVFLDVFATWQRKNTPSWG